MESSNLTDKQLLELAKLCDDDDVNSEDWDVVHYQRTFNIVSGKFKINPNHLYGHYSKWSNNPVDPSEFLNKLKLDRIFPNRVFINKQVCTINIAKLIGEYVKNKKREEKKERLRKISSIKSST